MGYPKRETVRSEAQDALHEMQINKVEFSLWKAREPRELAGLGITFMGPSANASVDTVQRWVAAQTSLKMGLEPDGETLQFLMKEKLTLLHPGVGLPLHWEVEWSSDDRPYFVDAETGKKQWAYPKGTDVRNFKRFLEETKEA